MAPEILSLVVVAAVLTTGALLFFALPSRIAAVIEAATGKRIDALERSLEKLERTVRDEIARNRGEAALAGGQLRDEVRGTLKDTSDSLQQRLEYFGEQLTGLSRLVSARLDQFQAATDARLHASQVEQTATLDKNRSELTEATSRLNSDLTQSMKGFGDSLDKRLADTTAAQVAQLSGFGTRLDQFQNATDERLRISQVEHTASLDKTKNALAEASTSLRAELTQAVKGFGDSLDKRLAETAATQITQLGSFGMRLDQFQKTIDERLHSSHVEQATKLQQATNSIADATVQLRAELTQSMKGVGDSLDKRLADTTAAQVAQIESFGGRLEKLTAATEKQLQDMRVEATSGATAQRTEVAQSMKSLSAVLTEQVTGVASLLKKEMETFSVALSRMTDANEKRLGDLRLTVDAKLQSLQDDNAKRLETMRQTVDEKLQGTLEKRLGESFKFVGERLEAVQAGLGEMRSLATGVGDLKKVLSNVKVRGMWGEIQLGNLLAQMLAPDQYGVNVATKPQGSERVEFAIKLPNGPDGQELLLPIDSKFPMEDYHRLVEASERGDVQAVEESARLLEFRIRTCAQDISAKYLNPPHTTDFGVLFLPTEGLYAEVVRRSGLVESLQREHRVAVAGPTTLAALLNSLQMGFKTLAIQKRSSEVWQLLSAVKTEFGKFGDVIGAVEKKLSEASNKLGDVGKRSRVLARKLRDVQELPAAESHAVLLQGAAEAVLEPLDYEETEA